MGLEKNISQMSCAVYNNGFDKIMILCQLALIKTV